MYENPTADYQQILLLALAVSVQGTPAPIVELEPPVPNIANFVETFHCDFDTDFCGMEQDSLDYLDFKLNRGETETNGTGPSYDHTSKEGNK